MQPYKRKNINKFIFFFYDLECSQDTIYNGRENVYEHIPNLCVVRQACYACIDNDEDDKSDCNLCGKREHIFEEDPIRQFIDHMRQRSFQDNFSCLKAVAHNAKAYDTQFFIKRFVSDFKWKPDIIKIGLRVLQMTLPDSKISFIDSISFMPLPLSGLPKAFNFCEQTKGFFCHYFNTSANQGYIGPYPDKSMYGYDSMSSTQRKEFLTWYLSQRDKTFNFKEEFLKYCKNDVDILYKASVRFRKDFLQETGIDPMLETLTIAGCSLAVFKKCFLQEDTIGIPPQGGYRLADKQSKVAIEWLTYLEEKRGITIQHAGNSREYKVAGIGKVFTGSKI
jgi:DNA polymerase type B, organellar and viral